MQSSSAHPPGQIDSSRIPLFVVDDDRAVLNSLRFSLEIEGFDVHLFHSAADLLGQQHFPERGCLVLDYKLPDGDGLDILARLRHRGVSLPAIIMTTAPEDALRRRARMAGAAIVEKPELGGRLVRAIHLALEPRA
jgi:two-component system, LuxR family, response regulator FixJ